VIFHDQYCHAPPTAVFFATSAATGGAFFHMMVDSLHESDVEYTSTSMGEEGVAATQYSFSIAEVITCPLGMLPRSNLI
jgi:hypothetical protein